MKKILYKNNRVWTIEGFPHIGRLSKTYGISGGKMQVSIREVHPKSNRTLEEQTELEFNSAVNRQRDKGYYAEGEDTSDRPTLPMLAKPYDPLKVTYPCIVQEKLNGVRCIATKRDGLVVLTSRKGKVWTTVPHINAQLDKIMVDGQVFDGELYSRGMSLNKIVSAVRGSDYTGPPISYYVYDVVSDEPYCDRFAEVGNNLGENIFRHIGEKCNNSLEITKIYRRIAHEGGEGIIIRDLRTGYQVNKRSWALMKQKVLADDEEFEVIDYKFDADGCVIWLCRVETYLGIVYFSVVPKGSKKSRQISPQDAELFLGFPLTVRYSEKSDYGVPQGNPVGLAFRDYE
jgi:hypothetical protein